VKIYKLSEVDKILNKLWWLRSTLSETKNARYSTMIEIQTLHSEFNSKWVKICVLELLFNRPINFFSAYDELKVDDLNGFLTSISKIDGFKVAQDSFGDTFIVSGKRLVRVLKKSQPSNQHWFSLVALNVQYLLGAGYHMLTLKVFKRRLKNGVIKRLHKLCRKIGFESKFFKTNLEILNFSEFKKLKMIHLSPMHQLVRSKSMDFVNEWGKLITVEDYLTYYSNTHNLEEKFKLLSSNSSKFTNENSLFEYPNWFNLNFWDSFNGHYFMNIFLGFRNGFMGYAYLDKKAFSEYVDVASHNQKEYLKDEEIIELIQGGDILIDDDVVCSGRHRVLAMIGHIIKGKKYVEFKVSRYPFNT
jgi:hypothetical protein